jgi:hypothetical protein
MLPLTGQPRQLDDLVRALCAMRRALGELREHYTQVVERLDPTAPGAGGEAVVPNFSTALPYPLREVGVFADVEHFCPGTLLYEATLVATGERVCIKFAPRSYAAAVHAAWAAAGLAPALLEHRVLPGGIHMIVMELCSPDDGWCMLSDTDMLTGEAAAVPSERAAALAAPPAPAASWAARDRQVIYDQQPQYVPAGMTGYEDLNAYGNWINDSSYGQVWVPRSTPAGWLIGAQAARLSKAGTLLREEGRKGGLLKPYK